MKHLSCRKNSVQNLNRFSQASSVLDAVAYNVVGIWRDLCVLLTWKKTPIRRKRPYLPLKHLSCRKYSFQNELNSHTETMCYMLLPLTQRIYYERFMCLFNLAEEACLKKTNPISTFKQLSSTQYSLQNLKRFSQRNNMVDAAASNIDAFLWRNSCVFQANRSTSSKKS